MKTEYFKKIIFYSLGLALFLFGLPGCAQSQPKSPKEVSITWSEIEQGVGLEVGDTLELRLPANPSTGYAWEVGFYNQTVLKPIGDPKYTGSSTKLGAEESQLMHFEAIGEGETELVMVYRRSFEDEGTDQEIFKIDVKVE